MFYESRLPYLPLVEDDGELAGFLARELVDREMSDLTRSRTEHDSIPDRLLFRGDLPEEKLLILMKAAPVLVTDRSGARKTTWTGPELLHAVNQRKKTTLMEELPKPAADTPAATGRDDELWLTRLVLAAVPHALFAAGLDGKTLFYNGAFERFMGRTQAFKNSLRLVESYFLELNRDLLTRTYLAVAVPPPKDGPIARTFIPEIDAAVEVSSLHGDNGQVAGYLYLVRESGSGFEADFLPLIEKGIGLEAILEKVEGAIILKVLAQHSENVSHAAKALGIKRSTLQNRIKKLSLNRKVDHPIPRKRTGESGKNQMRELVDEILKGKGGANRARPGRSPVSKSANGKNAAGKPEKKPAPPAPGKGSSKKKPKPGAKGKK